jgi:hypothetical protein
MHCPIELDNRIQSHFVTTLTCTYILVTWTLRTNLIWKIWTSPSSNSTRSYSGRPGFIFRLEDSVLFWISSFPTNKCRNKTLKMLRSIPFKTLPIHHSSITLPFDSIHRLYIGYLMTKTKKQTPWLLVRTRIIPTGRPSLVAEVSANFLG